jgi:hypothetical protein
MLSRMPDDDDDLKPCRLCATKLEPRELDAAGLCGDCKGKLGIVAMPPSRRPPAPCLRCNGMKFVRVIPREHAVYAVKHGYTSLIAPMVATFTPNVAKKLIMPGNRVHSIPLLEDLHGMFETYICVSCGYIEWYCHDPESIPIGPEYMTELVDHEADAPYR